MDAAMLAPVPDLSASRFDALLRDNYRKALGFAYRMAGSREDAEDLTMEAFTRAFRAFHRYDPARPFDRWLFRIIANLFIDRLRSRPRQLPLSLDCPLLGDDGDDLFSELPDDDSNPESMVLRGIMDERVEAALNSLRSPFRETVILADMEGMDYDECAELLGCAVGTVRSRLHRGRSMMRRHITGKRPGRREISPIRALPTTQ